MSDQSSPGSNDKATRALRDLHAFQSFTASLVQEESEQRVAQLVASALTALSGGPVGVVALRPDGVEGDWEFYGQIGGGRSTPKQSRTSGRSSPS